MLLVLVGSVSCSDPAPAPKAWEMPPPPLPEGALVDTEGVRRSTLRNGLAVLILEDHRLPRVVVGVTLRRGAGAEAPDEAGLAQFVASSMERGAGDRDALALARFVDSMGAELSVSSGWDSMGVGVSGLSSDLDSLLEVLADVALRPRFEPTELQKARAMQLASLASAIDDPGTRISWEMAGVLYPGHRYGLPLSGTKESVASFDEAAARALYRRLFVPGNAIVSVSGNVDAQQVEARLRELFGAWPAGPLPAQGPPSPRPAPASETLIVVDRPDLVQSKILVGQGGIARRYPLRIPALLVNAVLGGSGFSSRLMKRVRAEEGLAYGVGSWFSMRRRAGPFRIQTSTRVEETGRVVELLVEALQGIKSDPPSEEELSRVKSFVSGRFALNLETSDALMASLVSLDVYGLPADSLETYRARVAAVDPAKAAQVARKLFHPERIAVVVVGPAQQIVSQLEARGTVKVVPNDLPDDRRVYSP